MGAVVFLALWWGWDIHRRRKKRAANSTPPTGWRRPPGTPRDKRPGPHSSPEKRPRSGPPRRSGPGTSPRRRTRSTTPVSSSRGRTPPSRRPRSSGRARWSRSAPTLSRITGFVRIAAIAYALGASTLAGTYSYANEAPNIVYELLLGGVLTATLVPLFVRYHESHDDEAPSAIFTVAIARAGRDHADRCRRSRPGSSSCTRSTCKGPNLAAQQELATALLRLLMPQMLFYGIAALATAMLERAPTIPGRGVRTGAQQRRRRRGVPHAPAPRRRIAHRARACSTTTPWSCSSGWARRRASS